MAIINFTVTYDQLTNESYPTAGDDVDAEALVGSVTFTPQFADAKPIIAPDYSPRPAGLRPRKFTGYIDSDGQLRAERGADEAGVRLWANDPVLELDSLIYKVEFDLTTPMGEKVRVDGGYFEAPSTDTTVSLTNVLDTTGTRISTAVREQGYAEDIMDSGSTGRALVRSQDQAAAWSALGVAPAANLPSYVDDVLEYANLAAFPASGEAGKIYVARDTGDSYRWSGSTYVRISDRLSDRLSGSGVFYATEYGVIADGTPHNNVANLLDCFAACAAAGGGTVLLPAGTIDTSEADAWVIVTADSGNTYTNTGGIPLPVDTPITVRGQGTGATVLKLSPGFPRAFDFPQPVLDAPVLFRDITLRDFTVDQDNLTGLDVGPLSAVSGAVSLPPGWTTLPGVSAAAFKNARLVWFDEGNTGTAKRLGMAARINAGAVQVRNDSATTYTLSSGDQVQGCLRNHVIVGNYVDGGSVASGYNTSIDNLRIENVDAVNITTGVSTTGLASPNNVDLLGSIKLWVRLSGLTNEDMTPSITGCEFRNLRLLGGNVGIEANGSAGSWVDDVWCYDVFHDTLVDPVGNWPAANFHFGQNAWVGRVGVVRCHGRRSGDVGLEFNQPWEAVEQDCTWEDAYSGVYRTSFVIPAKTAAGPQKSTLNGAITDTATSATFTLPADVARAGLAQIDSELVWYSMASGWPSTVGADMSLTLVRGFNGTTPAAHANGATVTFVETAKTRIHSVRSTIRSSAAATNLVGCTPGYFALENAKLPLPPITIRDSVIEAGGGDFKEGQFVYWQGWQPDIDVQGLRIYQDGIINPQATATDNRAFGSAISWRWDWGSTLTYYTTIPGFTPPRVFGRDNEIRVHGVSKEFESYSVFAPLRGLMLLDFDFAAEVALQWITPAKTSLANLVPGNNWVVQLAPGSRLGVTAAGGFMAGGDSAPCALRVGSSTYCKIGSVLDVDIDASRLRYNGGESSYLPWAVDASNVGNVRFGRIRHANQSTAGYPRTKRAVRMVTANYTVSSSDEVVQVNTSGGPVTITLPKTATGSESVHGEPLTRGRHLVIIDTGFAAATNPITVTPNAADKINNGTAGAAVTINSNGGSLELLSTPSMPGWTRLNGDPREVAAAYYDSLTTTMSSKTLTTPKIEYVRAANDTNALYLQSVTNAVNYVQITPQVSTQPPIVRAAGSDANVSLQLRPKGNGNVGIVDGAGYGIAAFNFWGAASANGNYWIFSAGASGSNALFLSAAGGDTNVSINVLPKGSGALQVNGVPVSTNSTTSTHTAQQIELGHATDTTITRAAAGMVAVEGNPLGVKVAVPASATATGAVGQWAADSSWIYVCTGANTWVRAALATW